MDVDKLVEIPMSALPDLKSLFRQDWPRHLIGYFIIDNYQRWFQQTPNIPNLKIYSLNGDWASDGVFLAVDRFDLFLYSLTPNNSRLRAAMKLLDWSNSLFVNSLDDRLYPDVHQVLTELGLETQFHESYDLFFLPAEKGVKLQLEVTPPNVVLQRLSVEHAKPINGIWTARYHGSEFLIRRLIERNFSVGAFCSLTGDLMGCALVYTDGSNAVLNVKKEYNGRGVAKLLTWSLARERARMGQDCYLFISETNHISRSLTMKFQYEIIGKGHWIHTRPLKPFVWED